MTEPTNKQRSLQKVWHGMMRRCYNKDWQGYKWYGGRGITVCDEWHSCGEFTAWAIANGHEYGLDLDRIDNDGNYEPSNCRFVTRKKNLNNKRNNANITFDGKTQTVTEWAEELGIDRKVIYGRLYRGYTVERALKREVKNGGKQG